MFFRNFFGEPSFYCPGQSTELQQLNSTWNDVRLKDETFGVIIRGREILGALLTFEQTVNFRARIRMREDGGRILKPEGSFVRALLEIRNGNVPAHTYQPDTSFLSRCNPTLFSHAVPFLVWACSFLVPYLISLGIQDLLPGFGGPCSPCL